MGPSLEIGINKRKEKSRNGENETCGMEESGGKFPPFLINSVNENQKGEEKGNGGERGRKGKKGKENFS